MPFILALAHLNFVLFDFVGLVLTVRTISLVLDPRRRRRFSTLLTGIAWACVVFLGVVGTLHEMGDERAIHNQGVCESNERTIAAAELMYASDWDNVLPEPTQWMSGKLTYMGPAKSPDLWRCPSAPEPVGYAFNHRAGGLALSHIEDVTDLVLLQDAEGCGFSAGTPACLPKTPRHLGSDNFAFTDGHVKWFLREREGSLKW